ncbi:MAG TPA: sterol desaturase family protein [Polyangiaceae bacterium]|nr:sterol desaturase family protein [Polyangiaceae bacterium]
MPDWITPWAVFSDPARRVFWGNLLGAAGIATLVWFFGVRRRCSLLAFLFPKRVWLHRSALLDYRLLIVRVLTEGLLLAPFAVSVIWVTLAVARFFWTNVGVLPALEVDRAYVIALFSIIGFMAQDFARYWVHRLAHRVPVLWELHKLHHSAEVLTPFTVYRTHPIESVLMRGAAALAVGVVAGVMSWLFPGKVSGWAILGVDALGFVRNLLGANLRHSHVWLSYGRVLEHVLISPAQHQIHHSNRSEHYDRNFGSTFALWDWLGGTLYVTGKREKLTFGLPSELVNHRNTILSAFGAPLGAALRQLAVPLGRLRGGRG